MKRRAIALAAALTVGASLALPAAPASAADFCASRISGSSYYQHNFSSGGSVVATICATNYDVAGNATLYARGSYANVNKYMKLTITTSGKGTVSVDGNYYEQVYRARPSGLHTYSAVMYNGSGTKIVDGSDIDYE